MKTNKKGMTLIETLIAITIGLIVFTGMGTCIYYLLILNESTKAQTLIAQDLGATMERINNTSLGNLNTNYPNSQALTQNEVNNILGGYKVTGEVITVTYSSTTSDPREIIVTANWTERGRARSVSLRTIKRG